MSADSESSHRHEETHLPHHGALNPARTTNLYDVPGHRNRPEVEVEVEVEELEVVDREDMRHPVV